jgi:hypothetical protein
MNYARDVLISLILMFGIVTPSYSEPGTYSPLAYLSFVIDTIIFWALTVGLSKISHVIL